jgi:hypothetical protein
MPQWGPHVRPGERLRVTATFRPFYAPSHTLTAGQIVRVDGFHKPESDDVFGPALPLFAPLDAGFANLRIRIQTHAAPMVAIALSEFERFFEALPQPPVAISEAERYFIDVPSVFEDATPSGPTDTVNQRRKRD